MIRKSFYYAAVALLGLFTAFSGAVSATTGTVTATVTAQNISLTVTDGSVAYGTLAASASADTCTSHLSDLQTVTNNGNVAEDFNIKGINTTDWTLAGTAGSNAYVHKFANATCTTSFPAGTALTTTDQTLATNIAAAGTSPLNLQITTPSSSTVFTVQNPNVTVTAIAH
jgi:hypothetical protein